MYWAIEESFIEKIDPKIIPPSTDISKMNRN